MNFFYSVLLTVMRHYWYVELEQRESSPSRATVQINLRFLLPYKACFCLRENLISSRDEGHQPPFYISVYSFSPGLGTKSLEGI